MPVAVVEFAALILILSVVLASKGEACELKLPTYVCLCPEVHVVILPLGHGIALR
ncbi:MAG: hypothetical protein RXO35_03680 [Candidatus Micrarchaeota archaeon]